MMRFTGVAMALFAFAPCSFLAYAAGPEARTQGDAGEAHGPSIAPHALVRSSTRTLTLEQALATAQKHQPSLLRARASAEAARARAAQVEAGLWPSLSGNAQYLRSTANFAGRPGAVPQSIQGMAGARSFKSYDFFNFGVAVNQLVYDFGQTSGRSEAAQLTARGQEIAENAAWLEVAANVRAVFFEARANEALRAVAEEALANQERHLAQIRGFVEVGSRPDIDLAQARTDVANARVDLINAENGAAASRAKLNQAIGVESDTDYTVSSDTLPPVDGEGETVDALVTVASLSRPELRQLEAELASGALTVRALRGGYGPSLSLTAGLTEAGTRVTHLAWNWSLGAQLAWPIFEGGLTVARVDEAEANLRALEAQGATLRQQVRLDLEQALLRLRAAKAALGAASDAVESARVRVRLAEGRYQTGVGNALELSDAQLTLTRAQAQEIQADYNLSAARALLAKALGST